MRDQIVRLAARRRRLARIYRALLLRLVPNVLALSDSREADKRFTNIALPAEVIAYFHDTPDRLYQVEQWLPVYEQLHEAHPVLLVTRNLGSFLRLSERTSLPLVFLRQLRDLEETLERTDPSVCLYVNNAAGNFNVLGWRRALHAHLNHGESDKVSMASNQAKAYDVVFVAGEAAEIRYKRNLIAFDSSKLVRVGRPQLDLEFPPALPRSERRTVLYAPTWEGETESMNYTSVAKYGPRLIDQLLSHGGFRIVYRPHPRVATGSEPVATAHEQIVRRLEEANRDLTAGERHQIHLEGSILALFPSCDALITDVSSVGIDWLYLRTDAPLWICDPREDRAALGDSSPLAARTSVIDEAAMPDFAKQAADTLASDPGAAEREKARRLYFGDLAPGESTQQFLDTVDGLIARRNALLADEDVGHERGSKVAAAVS